jgi:hypothetical protein
LGTLTSSAQIECDLSDLTLTKLDCNDNNQFKVVINFAHQNTTTQFKLYINGEYKGLFPYSQLPITTDYLNGQTNDDYHFLIKDSEFRIVPMMEIFLLLTVQTVNVTFTT